MPQANKIVYSLFAVYLFLKLFTACANTVAENRERTEYFNLYSKIQEKADKAFAERSPETMMAFLDRTQDEQVYSELLEQLDRNCQENKNFISWLSLGDYQQNYVNDGWTIQEYLEELTIKVGERSKPIECLAAFDL